MGIANIFFLTIKAPYKALNEASNVCHILCKCNQTKNTF